MMKVLAFVCCLVLAQQCADAALQRYRGTKDSWDRIRFTEGCQNVPGVGTLAVGKTGYDSNCNKYVCTSADDTSYEYTIESCPVYSGDNCSTKSGTAGANYPACCPQPVGECTGVN